MAEKNLPMREMMVEIEERMRQMNYGEASIYAYWQCWRNLLQYAEGKGEAHFSVKLGEDFLLEKCHVDVYTLNEKPDMPEWKIRAFKRPIYVLAEYQSSGTIVRKNRMHRTEIPERFRAAAEHYAAACYGRYNGERTVSSRLYILKRFLLFLDQINVNTLIEINGVHISEFTKTMIGWAQRTIGSNLATLRHFFRFLYLERYHPKDLSLSVPRVNCGRTVKLPKIWTPNEVEKILTAVDRGTSAGKRDYAILLMVAHLGLRDSDIQNLKFENIHWENCCIRINQSKTGQLLELPLSEELGNAIIDYLKYGRPLQDTSQYVFVRHIAPYGKCCNYYSVLRKYLSLANIRLDTTKPHGLHTLRHTLATRLLEQKVPLQTISQILGHTSVNSTNVYLKVDLNSLRECALNPEEVFING